MKKIVLKMLLISIIVLSSCGSQKESNAATAAENYINALAKKNKSQVISLSCKEWEESATLEVDALLSVDAEVTGLKCEITGEDKTGTFVVCSGSLDLTYDDEIRAIDLSRRTYTLQQEDGQWRVCSYK
jgi:hypothetical protein